MGLLLDPDLLTPKLTRGGQEHDFYRDGERVFKVTRNGVFGLSPGIELALVSSSQDARRFHLWEASQGFSKIADSAYYRIQDNLGIFDAHDKNLVRADVDVLIPFDVIPCHPAGGFLTFIGDTLSAGHTLRAVRTVTTHRAG